MGIDPVKDAPRRQHYYFAHHYLRERAQENPRPLIDKLRSQTGARYLSFLWVSRGLAVKPEEDDFIPFDGLECFPLNIADSYRGALVQFPAPERVSEVHFVAILLPLFGDDSAPAEFFTLEFSLDEDRSKKTILGKWVGGSHLNYGTGPPPEKDAFVEAITQFLLGSA